MSDVYGMPFSEQPDHYGSDCLVLVREATTNTLVVHRIQLKLGGGNLDKNRRR